MCLVDLDRSAAARSVEFEPSEPTEQTRRQLSRGVSSRPMVTRGIIISCTPSVRVLHTVRMVSNGFSNLQYRGSGTEARQVHDSLALRTQQSAERFARSPVSPRHRRHREPRRIGSVAETRKPLRAEAQLKAVLSPARHRYPPFINQQWPYSAARRPQCATGAAHCRVLRFRFRHPGVAQVIGPDPRRKSTSS